MLPEIRLRTQRLLLVALPLGLLALLLLGLALGRILKAQEQTSWHPTEAKVTAATDGTVSYRYYYAERLYQTPPRSLIYRPGDQLTVYVDPERPSHSVVIPATVGISGYVSLAVGLWLLLLALGLAFSEDASLLLHRDGWRALVDRLSGAEGRAVRALQHVANPRNPKALCDALDGPLLRETRRMLNRYQGFMVPGYLADKTGMSAVLFVEAVEELIERDRQHPPSARRWWQRIAKA